MARIKPQALLLQSKKKKGPSGVSVTTIIVYILIAAVMVFSLYSTYKYWSRRSIVQTQDDQSTSKSIELKKSDIPKYASASIYLLDTSFEHASATGRQFLPLLMLFISYYRPTSLLFKSIAYKHLERPAVELYKDGSPDIVDEFIDFSQKGHFKGMQFTLVIKNFVIHGSKVERPEATEEWTSRGKHYSQLDTSLKHEMFMLGTSKVKHEGGGFDLFITTAPIPNLNDKINVFGRVIKGENVVQEIEEVDTDDHYRPKTPVRINEVTLKHRT